MGAADRRPRVCGKERDVGGFHRHAACSVGWCGARRAVVHVTTQRPRARVMAGGLRNVLQGARSADCDESGAQADAEPGSASGQRAAPRQSCVLHLDLQHVNSKCEVRASESLCGRAKLQSW